MVTNAQNPILAAATTPTNGYVLLEPSVLDPGNLTPTGGTPVTLSDYAQGAYVILFIAVIISAIVMLMYYGIAYMLSDVASFKATAQKRLLNILWGLGIALLSWLILKQINPDLLSINLTRITKIL